MTYMPSSFGENDSTTYGPVPIGCSVPKVPAGLKTPSASTVPSSALNSVRAFGLAIEKAGAKVRYKSPQGDTSKLLEFPVRESGQRMTANLGFAAAVAASPCSSLTCTKSSGRKSKSTS